MSVSVKTRPDMMQGDMGQGTMMCPMMSGMMQSGMGQGIASPGMMGQGMMGASMPRGGGMFGPRVPPMMNLSVDDVRGYLDAQLERLNNKRLKIGSVSAADGTINAEIVTVRQLAGAEAEGQSYPSGEAFNYPQFLLRPGHPAQCR